MPTLRYLHFDLSETTDGHTSLDAMASVAAPAWPALQAELAAVLGWAHQAFADGPGPLDDGCSWDCELQATRERSQAHALRFDPVTGGFSDQALAGEVLRHTVTLTLTGTAEFVQALQARFALGLDGDGYGDDGDDSDG